MIKQFKKLRNRGWLTVLTFATLFAPQVVLAQDKAPKDNRPMLFGFMVDGQMVQAKVVGGKVTATVTPRFTGRNLRRGFHISTYRQGRPFPKKQMKVSKGLVRFLDKDGNVAAELTHWNGGGNLIVAPRKVPVRLGITLGKSKTPGLLGKALGRNGKQRKHGKRGKRGKRGIPVDEVAPDGPADKAGMRAGDVIIEINGQKPATEELLKKELKSRKPGDTFKVKMLRDGEEVELMATLEAAPQKADPFGLVNGRFDTIVNLRRGELARAKKDLEALTAQQAALQALLQRQAARIRKEVKKEGALLDPKAKKDKEKDKERDKEKARDLFLRIQSELKKSSDKANERKKELDAKLDELKAEEARQNALLWMNRATRRRITFTQRNNKKPQKSLKVAKKRDPLQNVFHRLVVVDPKLTSKPEQGLGRQVKDLEKRMVRIEKLLEESLFRQREVERKAAREKLLRNRKKELDAKIREVRRLEGKEGEEGKEKDDAKGKR